MSTKSNIIITIFIINALAITGIVYEIGYFDDEELEISTQVTASLAIKFENLDDNETMNFEYLTTSESTVYGILSAAKDDGQYSITTSQNNNGLVVESIANWGNCETCEKEEGHAWTYSVNNISGETAPNRKVVNNGDDIIWIYSK